MFGWYGLASEGLGKLRIPISDEWADLPQVRRCVWSYGRWWRTKDAEFIAEQTLEVLEDSELLGLNFKDHFGVIWMDGASNNVLTGGGNAREPAWPA